MVRDNYNIVPLFLAVLLHVLLGASMILGFDFSSRKPPPMPLVIKGTLVADSTIVVPPPREQPAPPEPVVDTAALEQARIAAEEEKRRQDALIEQKRLDEIRRKEEALVEQQRLDELRRVKEAEDQRKREEAELERKRVEAEQERQREIERQRAENERLRRESEAAVLQDAINAEDARLQAMNSNEMAAYQFALQQKVLRNWARPASARAGLDCLVQVRQTATGEVISANVVSCNGDAAVERSIVAAVHKASPLPLPENTVLFDPNLRFRFIPEQ